MFENLEHTKLYQICYHDNRKDTGMSIADMNFELIVNFNSL